MADAALPSIIVAAGALVRADGRVLVQQRGPGAADAGLWEFPGGKIEPGETAIDALVRELAEELGIVVPPAACAPLSFAQAPLRERHLLLLLFRVDAWGGEPRPLDAAALRWTTPDEMAALPMPPADRPLVAVLAATLAG